MCVQFVCVPQVGFQLPWASFWRNNCFEKNSNGRRRWWRCTVRCGLRGLCAIGRAFMHAPVSLYLCLLRRPWVCVRAGLTSGAAQVGSRGKGWKGLQNKHTWSPWTHNGNSRMYCRSLARLVSHSEIILVCFVVFLCCRFKPALASLEARVFITSTTGKSWS